MGELLNSQPLVEALCEFHFNLSGDNQLTLPGLFYAQVRNDFPIQEPINEFIFQIEIANLQGGVQNITQAQRLQLKREDHSALLQIGTNRLIINQLKPYQGWDNFKSLILESFRKYVDVCGDFTLTRISLRYINHIIPTLHEPPPNEISLDEGFNIEDYLTIIPWFPNPLDKPITGFQQSYEFRYDTPNTFLVHKTGVATNSDGVNVLILDLDFISQQNEDLQNNSQIIKWLGEWLDKAHNHIKSVFISSLTPIYYESLK